MKKTVKSGIYKITNLINSKKYIGKAENLEKRLNQHRNGQYSNVHLQNSIKCYGIENFKFEIVEYCRSENLWIRERFWVAYYNAHENGYNDTDGGENQAGWHFSEEVKEKMRKPKSKETRELMSERALGNHHSEEYWNDEENRTRQSKKTEELWKTEEYRQSKMDGQERYKNSEKKKQDDIIRSQKSKEFNNRPEEKEKRRKKMKGNKYGAGRKHMTDGVDDRMAAPDQVDELLAQGYYFGRPGSKTSKVQRLSKV